MRNIKLTIQYDGSAYIGWQRQAPQHGPTLQQELETALREIMKEDVTIHGAGRTDKGVHALAQVANFHCPTEIPVERLARALNHLLPRDLLISGAEEVGPDFHARLSAKGKRFRYLLAADAPTPFNWRWYWPQQELPNPELMQEAAQYLVGEHDFCHFTLANTTVTNFVRRVESIRVYEPPAEELPCRLVRPLAIEATANGFLYKMVRLIVCRLLAVGQSLLEPCNMQDFLQGNMLLRLPPAPPQGLMLMQVYYDEVQKNL